MSSVGLLTKVLLKTSFLTSNSSSNKRKNSKTLGYIGIALLVLFVVGSLGVPIVFGLDYLLEIVPLEKLLLSIILPLAGVTTIVFSVFSVVNVFYMSKDIEHLLPLPLSPRDIMLSKFFVSLINEYYILLMLMLPCLIGVGVGMDAGVLYYVYTCLIFVLLPVIPSVIVTLFILFITKITGVIKNKDAFMYVSMGLILVFAFGYNYIVQNVVSVDVDNIGSTLQSIESSILPYFEMLFPFYNSAVVSLTNYNNINGLFSFVAFFGFNIIALFIVYFLGDKLYLKSLIVTRGNKKKKNNIEEMVKREKIKKESSFKWLLKKEWLIIKRSPIFMLNIVIIVFLMPVVLLFSFGIAYVSSGGNLNDIYNMVDISSHLSNPLAYLIIMIIAVFFTGTSFCASTSISREGSSAWVMKVIPVSYFKQINVKVLFAAVLDLIGVILVGVVPVILYSVPLYYLALVFIPLIIIVFILNYLNIYIDLRRPKLKWEEESVAVKQNLNGLVSMLITFAVSAIFGLLAVVFYLYNIKINVIVLSAIITFVSGILLVLLVYKFYKNKDRLLINVD